MSKDYTDCSLDQKNSKEKMTLAFLCNIISCSAHCPAARSAGHCPTSGFYSLHKGRDGKHLDRLYYMSPHSDPLTIRGITNNSILQLKGRI